jgi:hypothetical protein
VIYRQLSIPPKSQILSHVGYNYLPPKKGRFMAIRFRSNPLLEISAKGVLMLGSYLATQYTIGYPLSNLQARSALAAYSAIGNACSKVSFRYLRECGAFPREASLCACLKPQEFLAGFFMGQLIGAWYSMPREADIPMAWGIFPSVSIAYLLVSEFLFHSVKQCALLIKNRQERPLEMDAVQDLSEVLSVIPLHDHQNCQEGGCLMRNDERGEGYAAL